MDVLKLLRVFIDKDSGDGHFRVARAVMQASSRLVSLTFVEPERGRYTVPALCGYGDIALWISKEASWTIDVSTFWRQAKAQDLCAVYVPKGEKDSPAPSMMLFRNKYCQRLTPEYVYHATPEQLAPSVWAGGPQNVGILEV